MEWNVRLIKENVELWNEVYLRILLICRLLSLDPLLASPVRLLTSSVWLSLLSFWTMFPVTLVKPVCNALLGSKSSRNLLINIRLMCQPLPKLLTRKTWLVNSARPPGLKNYRLERQELTWPTSIASRLWFWRREYVAYALPRIVSILQPNCFMLNY